MPSPNHNHPRRQRQSAQHHISSATHQTPKSRLTHSTMVLIEELSARSNPSGGQAHAWSLSAADRLGRLQIVDQHDDDAPVPLPSSSSGSAAAGAAAASFLDPREAERLVDELVTFGLKDVGSSRWLRQHQALERLNLQAHQSAAATGQEEFVVEAFVSLGKVPALVHALVVMDCWRTLLWPRLREGVLAANASVRAYFVLYHEATVVNLLEVLLFHGHACAAGGDALVDLVDYVAAQAALLNSGEMQRELAALAEAEEAELRAAQALPDARARAEALACRPPAETLRRQELTLRFQTAVAAVGVLRCLCSHAERELPLSALGRMVQTHDLVLALVPLIENPPWTRRRSAGKDDGNCWEKYVDFAWRRVPNRDLLLLTKAEAQPWLALFHLLASPRVQARHHLHAFRKGQLLRVRRYLNEALLDQLPVLADVRRFLDEASLQESPEPTAGPAAFLLEEVAAVRAAVLANVPAKGEEAEEWCAAEAERQLSAHFAGHGGDARDEDLKALASVYGPEWAEAVLASTGAAGDGPREARGAGIVETEVEVEDEKEGRSCAHCGQSAAKRCGQCLKVWYCGRACQTAAWKSHRKACAAAAKAAAVGAPQQD